MKKETEQNLITKKTSAPLDKKDKPQVKKQLIQQKRVDFRPCFRDVGYRLRD